MPSHLSTIGFDVQTPDDFVALAQRAAQQALTIPAKRGHYLQWTGRCGEELWIQIDADGELVGMNPHFRGKSSVRVGLHSRVFRENHTCLDGAFHGWADPEQDTLHKGAYPLVFDVPDAAIYSDLDLPDIVEAQIAAFAHEISFHESPASFNDSQAGQVARFASRSFIPSGLFSPDGVATEPPEGMAIFTGHVVEAGIRRNSMCGAPFYWALVDTLGGRYDVVVDQSLLAEVPFAGGVLSGAFWLSGRLTSFRERQRGWFRRILGGDR